MDQPPVKRFREEEPSRATEEPSPVVHISNLSPQVTEADVLEALGVFGSINYASVKRYRGTYGLVEFESVSAAATCVNAATVNAIFIGGAECRISFSTVKSIMRVGFETAQPNHVLVITVSNLKYLINATTLKDICSAHGEPLRVAVVKRAHMLTSLVEFASADVAKAVKHAINGADIYSGCCTIKAEYANVNNVRITIQDADHIDLVAPKDPPPASTRKTLIQGPPPTDAQYYGAGSGPAPLSASNNNTAGYQAAYARDAYGADSQSSRDAYGRSSYESPPMAYTTRDAYGREIPVAKPQTAYDAYQAAYPPVGSKRPLSSAPPPAVSGSGYPIRDAAYPPTYPGAPPGLAVAQRPRDEYFGDIDPNVMGGGQGCVVLIYGVDQAKLNCDKIFNVFCQYGNVLRILFMKNKPDTVILEMGTPSQARDLVQYLNGIQMFGLNLQLKGSFQDAVKTVRDPFELPDASPSFRDYSQSRNQRFQNAVAAERNRQCHPQAVLHWFNAPPEMDGDKISDMFRERGAPTPTTTFVFTSKTGRSASGTAEFASIVDATEALALCNHTPVSSAAGKHPFIVKISYTTSRAPGARSAVGGAQRGAGDADFNGH